SGEATLAEARGATDHDHAVGFEPGFDLRDLCVAPDEARLASRARNRARRCSLRRMVARSGGWHRRHDKLPGSYVGTDTQLWAIVVRQIVEMDGRARLGKRLLDRSALSQATVEPDGELLGRCVADGSGHAHDTADVRQQRVRQQLAIAGVENDELH